MLIQIQIQHLLMLNYAICSIMGPACFYSNTTLVNVKLGLTLAIGLPLTNSNTTLVNVKFCYVRLCISFAQIFKYNTC